jgi:hypothetical protein
MRPDNGNYAGRSDAVPPSARPLRTSALLRQDFRAVVEHCQNRRLLCSDGAHGGEPLVFRLLKAHYLA